MEFPHDDAVVADMCEYAKLKLPQQTFNHSMRVYYFATAMVRQQFPEHAADLSPVTLALACLLHDIGTAEEHMAASRMSFEFYGAVTARSLVMSAGGPQDQADAVCESIIRHQDLGVDGAITLLGQVLQLATIYDNVGEHPSVDGFAGILHRDTREDVIKRFPREGWLGCFAATLRREVALKPWCHTTHIPDFERKVMGNELMRPYE
ncbi:Cyanamide hydratase, HD-type [Ophiocordyceps sinensis CO18]|nr:Cyanamide hydratase, HD-type [Ophiocordyceps sinensis CO18]